MRPYSPRNPKTLVSRKVLRESICEHPPIPSRHGLWLRLRRYLIVFDSTLLYSTPTRPFSTPPLQHSTLLHPYSTLLYTLPLLHSTLYSAPTPLYPTLPLQHSSLLTQPQLHPTLLHPYSTLPLLHLARHLRRRAPQLRTLHTHYDTSDCCPVLALLHCYTAALSLCTLCPSCPPARYRPADQ